MSALDDAIASHMTHGAGACADPLTDSLFDQMLPPPHPVAATRPGWENEPIAPPIPWRLYGLVAAGTVVLSALLSGCGGDSGPDDTTSSTQPVDCKARPELCK